MGGKREGRGRARLTTGEPVAGSLNGCPLEPGPDEALNGTVRPSGPDKDPFWVVMYSHDGMGLGHLRRNTNIANAFTRDMPNANVLLLAGCPLGTIFPPSARVDLVKLPSILKNGTNVWRPRTLVTTGDHLGALRANLIRQTVKLLKPRLFLADHMPAGVWGDLLPTLKMIKASRSNRPKVVLGLRDIVDDPEVVRAAWRRDGIYDVIARYYDEILIYGSSGVFETVPRYGLDNGYPGGLHYCGYLCSEQSYEPREQVRGRLGISDQNLVVITAGGGYDAYPMMGACLDAVRVMAAEMPLKAVLITGPLMPEDHRMALKQRSVGLPVQVLESVPDSLSYLNAADLVVSMAGYNTVIEAIRLRKRTLLVPRQGPSAEQRTRAKMLGDMGLVRTVPLAEASPEHLAQAMRRYLACETEPSGALRLDGLTQTVAKLKHMIGLGGVKAGPESVDHLARATGR